MGRTERRVGVGGGLRAGVIMCKLYRKHFLLFDFGFSLVSLIIVLTLNNRNGYEILSDCLSGGRSTLYSTMATLSGSLVGFAIAAVSIVIVAVSDNRLWTVRESPHYPTLWRSYFIAIGVLGGGTVISIIALLADKDAANINGITPQSIVFFHIAFFFWVYSGFALKRCVSLLSLLIKVISTEPR